MRLRPIFLLLLPIAVSSFSTLFTRTTNSCSSLTKKNSCATGRLYASENDDDTSNSESADAKEPGLVLDGLDKEMSQMASKFSFTESDFLAAAKKRAQERVESKNSSAKDSDWKNLAEQKKEEVGEIDDWENSMKEAGNEDSQILMFSESGGDDDDGEEPKLLLF
mmetsp:Transcript_21824/g.35126  ORF Transcript_21824/g.35126 Transcript_21824/m.35126 type:complete len:165 (-) Transcript_21824:621-1115(-)